MNSKRLSHLYIFTFISMIMVLFAQTSPIRSVRGRLQSLFFTAQRSLYTAANGTQSFGSTLSQIQNLAKENTDLRSENEKLKGDVAQLQELKLRVMTLEKEFGIQGIDRDKKYIPAAVVGRSPSSFRSVITIDKGKQDGIAPHQPVLSGGFLIGKVIDTFQSSSQVELITSHRFLTPVVLQNSRLLGLMRGGVKGIEIGQLSIDGTIQMNETVVTSGLAGEIPAGLPVGYVKQVTSQPSDIFQSVTISTPISINQIELVLVIIGDNAK